MNLIKKVKNDIIDILGNVDLLKDESIEETLETPPQVEFGDLSSKICFSLSKKFKKSPHDIANEIVKEIKIPKDSFIKKVEAKTGYINFFFNYSKITRIALRTILKEKDCYGSSKIGNKKIIMVEFAHPNTHKGFHVGHLRNISTGESICRILDFTGHNVVRANYQGDIGPHVAKALWGFINLYKCKAPKENKGEWIGEVYSEVNKKFSDDERVNKEVLEINNKLYSGNKKTLKLWKMTRKWSLEGFEKIYKQLETKFDKYYFESDVEKRAVKISKELLKESIAKLSEGATIIDLSEYNLGIFVLLTKEGNPVYESKDLALAEMEFDDFKIDRCIHVVGSEQKLYFQQLFKVFELINSPGSGKSYHLVYELVNLKTGKMSSRLGSVVLYTQLMNEILKKIQKQIEERNPKLNKKEKQDLAKKIAVGALKYGMLSMSCDKILVFDWEKALMLEGNTGPYLQYAHTRCNGILNKAKKWKENFVNENFTCEERKLVKKLSEFPEVVEQALRDFRPHYLCNYAYELATIFSEFYHLCPVLKTEKKELKNFRLSLVKATKITLKNCLWLLGIDAPAIM
jgi:arginyl-tRNA synthetase